MSRFGLQPQDEQVVNPFGLITNPTQFSIRPQANPWALSIDTQGLSAPLPIPTGVPTNLTPEQAVRQNYSAAKQTLVDNGLTNARPETVYDVMKAQERAEDVNNGGIKTISSHSLLNDTGLTDPTSDAAHTKALVAKDILRETGNKDAFDEILASNLPYEQKIAKLQQMRDTLAKQVELTSDPTLRAQHNHVLDYIDGAIKQQNTLNSRANDEAAYQKARLDYEQQVVDNRLYGTPVTMEKPENQVWHLAKDKATGAGDVLKSWVLPGYDTFGNGTNAGRQTYIDPNTGAEMYGDGLDFTGKPVAPASSTQPLSAANVTPLQGSTSAPSMLSGVPLVANTALGVAKSQQSATPSKSTTASTAKGSSTATGTAAAAASAASALAKGTFATQPAQATTAVQHVQQVAMGSNGYPMYEQLPNGGYRYDTTYIDPQGLRDPYAMPDGIRRNKMAQAAYWNLQNSAEHARAQYEQSRATAQQGQATADLMQVQADPMTHQRAKQYMASMGLNAQEAMNLATAERAQALGVWGAASRAYAPMQQGLDSAAIRNTGAGLYYGYDSPYMVSVGGYGGNTAINGVTYNADGTVNVVAPNGQVVQGININQPYAVMAAGGTTQGAAAAKMNAAQQAQQNYIKAVNSSYGSGVAGAPTNAQIDATARQISSEEKKSSGKPTNKPQSPL